MTLLDWQSHWPRIHRSFWLLWCLGKYCPVIITNNKAFIIEWDVGKINLAFVSSFFMTPNMCMECCLDLDIRDVSLYRNMVVVHWNINLNRVGELDGICIILGKWENTLLTTATICVYMWHKSLKRISVTWYKYSSSTSKMVYVHKYDKPMS